MHGCDYGYTDNDADDDDVGKDGGILGRIGKTRGPGKTRVVTGGRKVTQEWMRLNGKGDGVLDEGEWFD